MKNHRIQKRPELPNRRSKDSSLESTSDEAQISNKIIKKSLNFANISPHKDDLHDSSSCTFENSMLEDNEGKESTEILLLEKVNSPWLSASLKASVEQDFSPSSVITTNGADLTILDGDETSDAAKSEFEVGVELEMVARYLKQSRLQMLNSTGMDLRFKKLLDALLDVITSEFCSMPDERDWMDQIISAKNSILFLCFLMCLISTPVILLLRSGIGSSGFYPPPPT